MNISKLKYLAGGFFVLILSIHSAFAQGRKMDKSESPNKASQSVVERITGLSTPQKEQINQLENGYRLVMGELRTQAQTATDSSEKSALRDEMQQITQSHQNNIKRLLTKDQKKEYSKLLAENTVSQSPQNMGKGQGKGSGGMRGSGQGRRY